MSKIPFASLSEEQGETSKQWKQTSSNNTKGSRETSDDDVDEQGDVGVGNSPSYQKSGPQIKPSVEDGPFDEDFTNINSKKKQRNKSYLWFRHPKVRENWKTVTGALFLLIIGLAFLIIGIVLAALPDHDGPKAVIFFVCAAVCLLPGGYHTIYIYRATKGWRGYNFESLPNFQ